MSDAQGVERRTLAIGVALVLLGCGLAVPTATRVTASRSATGRVHSLGNVSVNGDGYPVTIVFKDARGKPHRLRTKTQRTTALRLGESVDVVYDPADPAGSAQVDRMFRVWLWPLLALAAGVLFIFFRKPIAAQRRAN